MPPRVSRRKGRRHLPQAPSSDQEVRVQRRRQKPDLHHRPSFVRIMICNDSNYPELATGMVARGAMAIFLPSNNSLSPESANVVALSRAVDIALAKDNGVMIVRADVPVARRTGFVRPVSDCRRSRNGPPGRKGVERGHSRRRDSCRRARRCEIFPPYMSKRLTSPAFRRSEFPWCRARRRAAAWPSRA